ncbi:hypothetical protein LCGC14_1308860 [marine sediment metagenome]|uniref:Uncharacterized protein n=1 Tax=marine sediment metagenome TaxID=412755 RepID=A0A0F9NQF3_9ZZZZ
MVAFLACGHPPGCLVLDITSDDEDATVCAWCMHVAGMHEQIGRLEAVLEGKAVVIQPGATAVLQGPIGLLRMEGGVLDVRGAVTNLEMHGGALHTHSPESTLDVASGS